MGFKEKVEEISKKVGDTATNKQYMYLFAEHWVWDNRAGNYSKRSRRFL